MGILSPADTALMRRAMPLPRPVMTLAEAGRLATWMSDAFNAPRYVNPGCWDRLERDAGLAITLLHNAGYHHEARDCTAWVRDCHLVDRRLGEAV